MNATFLARLFAGCNLCPHHRSLLIARCLSKCRQQPLANASRSIHLPLQLKDSSREHDSNQWHRRKNERSEKVRDSLASTQVPGYLIILFAILLFSLEFTRPSALVNQMMCRIPSLQPHKFKTTNFSKKESPPSGPSMNWRAC